MTRAIDSSASATIASIARLSAAASNIASAGTRGPVPPVSPAEPVPGEEPDGPRVYQAVQTVQQQVGVDGSGGVAYAHQPVRPSYATAYDPTAVFADPRGLVAAPHVDFTRQTAEEMRALDQYRLNARLLESGAAATKALLDIRG